MEAPESVLPSTDWKHGERKSSEKKWLIIKSTNLLTTFFFRNKMVHYFLRLSANESTRSSDFWKTLSAQVLHSSMLTALANSRDWVDSVVHGGHLATLIHKVVMKTSDWSPISIQLCMLSPPVITDQVDLINIHTHAHCVQCNNKYLLQTHCWP